MDVKQYLKNPLKIVFALGYHGYLNWVPDSIYLRLVFKALIGRFPNLKNPQTFNEKLQWLKLYDRKPEYSMLVDKYAVKKYVAERIGEKYIIPTFGVWDKFDDIDFEKLPNQFVLKCTHDSGGLVICKDKSKLDKVTAKDKIEKCLKYDYYYLGREWPYKNVPHKIIAEKYMEDGTKVVPEDYKIYCFNGSPKYIVVFHNRFKQGAELSETVYDVDWNCLHISLDEHFKVSDVVEEKPACLDELLWCAKTLADGFVQSRIDFYIIDGKIYFGEITLFTACGFQKMIPEELDLQLGQYIDLSLVNKN